MKQHRFLNRVTLTILLLVFIPLLLLSIFMGARTNREVKNRNQAYYLQVVNSFATDFEQRLTTLQNHAITITVDSRLNKSIFHQGLERAKLHPYWYYQAMLEMQELYHHYDASNCGVYYYEVDRAVTVAGSTAKQFLLSTMNIRDPEHSAWDFFDEANYRPGAWIFGSTITDPGKNAYLLAGYCTELGYNKDKVMIFYTLSRDDYAGIQSVVYRQSGINFYIKDSSGTDSLMFIGDSTQNSGEVYRADAGHLPLVYEILVSDNSPESSRQVFYRDTWVSLAVLALVLVVFCAVSIFIVYRPVSAITAELGTSEPLSDEFSNIRYVLNERNSTIMEQDNLILDLLLKHLIHGVPVNLKALERLGVAEGMDHYCVFLLSGYLPTASETEYIAGQISQKYPAHLFRTDWQASGKSIFILFQKGADVEPVAQLLEKCLREYSGEDALLVQGNVADNTDGIRGSFLSATERLNALLTKTESPAAATAGPEAPQKTLEKQILDYLDVHFREPELNQVQVADAFRISTYTLSRLFKNQVGIGFAEYVNTRRLEYARILLQTTSLPIKEIAVQCGYASESYFGRIFKATYGVSPSAFKEQ